MGNAGGDWAEGEFDLAESLAGLDPTHTVILTDSPRLLERLASSSFFPSVFSSASSALSAVPVSSVPSVSSAPLAVSSLYAELILVPERRAISRATFECARRLGVPVVATHDVHFADAADYALYRILRAMSRGVTVGRLDCDWEEQDEAAPSAASPPASPSAPFAARLPSPYAPPIPSVPPAGPEHWMRDRCELRALWRGLREEVERSVAAIAEACRLELPLGQWRLPRPHLAAGETPFSRLWQIAFAGLQTRQRPLTRAAIDRLRREIETLDSLGFASYFLVVHEIAEEARRRGMHVLGRGSAANSLVSYALGFTGVDPLRHNLYFERFLNAERRTPPDIDLDLSWKDRDALVDWVFERFGRDHVALISTTVRLQTRLAIREVAHALGIPDRAISRLTGPIPYWHGGAPNGGPDLTRLDELFPECRGLPLREEPWRTVLAHASRLIGAPSHYGIHCGGLLITPEPIWRYTPLVRAAKGFVVTQMDMRPIEALGLIKIDLLGNRSLGVLRDTLGAIASSSPLN